MDADQVSTGLRELRDLIEQHGIGHHEMNVKGFPGEGPELCRQIGKEQESRGKVAIGNINVKDVGMGFDALQISGKRPKIGRPQ